jgi:two-component system chemotaxis sensor kinase CheA
VPASSAPAGGRSGDDSTDFLRIRKDKLDHLMNLVGELITVKNLFNHLSAQIEDILPSSEITKTIKEGTGNITRLSARLQESVMNARMVPIGTVFSKYQRLVRDVSKKLGKKINLVIEGEDTELDKTVSEAISDPLMHLLRNAIDHGVEMPEDRIKRGKSEFGTILLKAGYEGNNVRIAIKDDGHGIDATRIASKAISLGLATQEQISIMTQKDIIDFIFHSGFSTAQEITDVSGRGVGMDVVRSNIRKSGGNILIHTEVGKGTEFRLVLPLSLAVVDALLIGSSKEIYALPQEVIIETYRIQRSEITNLNNQPSINLRNEVIPVLELSKEIPLRKSILDDYIAQEKNKAGRSENQQMFRNDNTVPVVICNLDGIKIGLLVDELYWQEQIMIKPLGGFLSSNPIFAGACIMGNGDVVLVIEAKELYMIARNAERALMAQGE